MSNAARAREGAPARAGQPGALQGAASGQPMAGYMKAVASSVKRRVPIDLRAIADPPAKTKSPQKLMAQDGAPQMQPSHFPSLLSIARDAYRQLRGAPRK